MSVPRGIPCQDCGAVVGVMNAERRARDLQCRPLAVQGAHLAFLHARHQEEGIEACLEVARKMAWWLDSERDAYYYRPTTLFRARNFPEYLAAPERPGRARRDAPPDEPSEEVMRKVALVDLEAARAKKDRQEVLTRYECIALFHADEEERRLRRKERRHDR